MLHEAIIYKINQLLVNASVHKLEVILNIVNKYLSPES